jgi:hypothetical protein
MGRADRLRVAHGSGRRAELARASGFKGVIDLLKVAKHGRGENVYLVRFHYVPPRVR